MLPVSIWKVTFTVARFSSWAWMTHCWMAGRTENGGVGEQQVARHECVRHELLAAALEEPALHVVLLLAVLLRREQLLALRADVVLDLAASVLVEEAHLLEQSVAREILGVEAVALLAVLADRRGPERLARLGEERIPLRLGPRRGDVLRTVDPERGTPSVRVERVDVRDGLVVPELIVRVVRAEADVRAADDLVEVEPLLFLDVRRDARAGLEPGRLELTEHRAHVGGAGVRAAVTGRADVRRRARHLAPEAEIADVLVERVEAMGRGADVLVEPLLQRERFIRADALVVGAASLRSANCRRVRGNSAS